MILVCLASFRMDTYENRRDMEIIYTQLGRKGVRRDLMQTQFHDQVKKSDS